MNPSHRLIGTSWESGYSTSSVLHSEGTVQCREATHLTLVLCLHAEPTSLERDRIGSLVAWLLSNNSQPNVVNKLKPNSGVWFCNTEPTFSQSQASTSLHMPQRGRPQPQPIRRCLCLCAHSVGNSSCLDCACTALQHAQAFPPSQGGPLHRRLLLSSASSQLSSLQTLLCWTAVGHKRISAAATGSRAFCDSRLPWHPLSP